MRSSRRRGHKFSQKTRLATASGAATVLAVASLVAPEAASATTQPPKPGPIDSRLGVTVDSNGTFHYSTTLADSLGLVGKKTVTNKGMLGKNDSCVFKDKELNLGPETANGYTEETSYNPQTCVETLVTGQLTPSGTATLAAADPKAAPPTSTPSTPSTSTSPDSVPPPGGGSGGSWSEFEKVSYVDPFDITITSLVDNMSWKSNGYQITSVDTSPHSYEFAYDGWTEYGITRSTSGYPLDQSYTKSVFSDSWQNTDFEALMEDVAGAFFPGGATAVWLACGATNAPANFSLAPAVKAYPSGNFDLGHSESVSGGCHDLVHFRENHGSGTSG